MQLFSAAFLFSVDMHIGDAYTIIFYYNFIIHNFIIHIIYGKTFVFMDYILEKLLFVWFLLF